VTAQGFNPLTRDVDVRIAVPIDMDLSLQLAGTTESVQVVGKAEDLAERDRETHPIKRDMIVISLREIDRFEHDASTLDVQQSEIARDLRVDDSKPG
jgi:hypothetical protein